MGYISARLPGAAGEERFGRGSRAALHLASDSAISTALDERSVSFSRSSPRAVRDTYGRMAYVGPHTSAWFHHDLDGDGIFEQPGRSLHAGATNGFIWSEDLTQAAYIKNNVTVGSNVIPSPVGGKVADEVTISTASSVTHYVQRTDLPAASANTLQSQALFAKYRDLPWLCIATSDKANVGRFSYINIQTGTKGTSIDIGHTISLEPWADGWYRIMVSWNVASGGSTPTLVVYLANGDGATLSFAGTVGTGVYLTGFHAEANHAWCGPYIPTTSSTVTHNTPNCSVEVAWGESDVTVRARIARQHWMSVPGTHHITPLVFSRGVAPVYMLLGFLASSRSVIAELGNGVGVVTNVSKPIPSIAQAPHAIDIVAQYKNLLGRVGRNGPKCALDVADGSGLSADSSGTIPAYTVGALGTTLQVGDAGWSLGNTLSSEMFDLVGEMALVPPDLMRTAS
ncbi:MAG TPA: hypothetical protein VFN76_10025 [Candidatus Limnocylindria bacterium]|nr:hypothetical protein [Candidatus Limnocylindria bacterium]